MVGREGVGAGPSCSSPMLHIVRGRALVSLATFDETRQTGMRFKFLMIMYLQLAVSVDVTLC
jgi:hypothetical protein